MCPSALEASRDENERRKDLVMTSGVRVLGSDAISAFHFTDCFLSFQVNCNITSGLY